MTQDELKEVMLSHVSLDASRRASIESFFEEVDNITVENFQNKYRDWQNSGNSKNAIIHAKDAMQKAQDAEISVGLNAIQNNDYTVCQDPDTRQRFGLDKVLCNQTGLEGIITVDGTEVVPCIFEYVNIHLDGYIELTFKGMDCTLLLFSRDLIEIPPKREGVFIYGEAGAFKVSAPRNNDLTSQLYDLLSSKH